MKKQHKEDFTKWTPHKGPYKLIKLKIGEGLTPPMVEQQPIKGVRIDERRYDV